VPSSSLRRPGLRPSGPPERPGLVPFAVTFGVLLTVEVLYLGWLLWSPDPTVDWFLYVPLALALAAAAGSWFVLRGRRWGWAVLAVAAVLPLLALLVLTFLLGAFGAHAQMWAAVALLIGPLATLVLALRRPVREWCGGGTGRANRSPGGRRTARSAR
jgi:hypothetical protein